MIWHTRWEINHPKKQGSKGVVWPWRGALTGNKKSNSWSKSVQFYTERNAQEHFDLASPALATICYQVRFRGLICVCIFGSVWHENHTAWKFTCRRHWEDESAVCQRPMPPLVHATVLEHYLHELVHRGHTQADHTLCAKACMTHTHTHTQLELGIWLCR